MFNSLFWKCVAAAGVVGLFYVGHGLHSPGEAPPSLIASNAHAVEMQRPRREQAPDAIVWETIGENLNATTQRAKAKGGWLVWVKNTSLGVSGLTFVPDPNFSWQP